MYITEARLQIDLQLEDRATIIYAAKEMENRATVIFSAKVIENIAIIIEYTVKPKDTAAYIYSYNRKIEIHRILLL